MTEKQLLRILDANFNRSREGLRVAEEVARFVLNDRALTAQLKAGRHAVTAALKGLPMSYSKLVAARDTRSDVGRGRSVLEKPRSTAKDLFLANTERAKESLRVLEECSKLIDTSASDRLKKVRFQIYAAEKKALPKLEALSHHR